MRSRGTRREPDMERGRVDARKAKAGLTLPKILRLGPEISGLREPDSNEGGTDGEGNEETKTRAEEDLPTHAADEALGVGGMLLGAVEGGRVGEVGAVGVRACGTLLRVLDESGRVGGSVLVGDLFDETKEDGDDDGRLKGLTEDDEEDGDGEDVLAHDC